MTRGELLQQLLAGHRNPDEFKRLAEELIADERARGNKIFSSSLRRALDSASHSATTRSSFPATMATLPVDPDKRVALTEVVQPEKSKSDLVLSATNTALLASVLAELSRADLLKRHGLRPASKLLF